MSSSDNRQLSAITFIDIVNFSKLMHEDEAKAIHLLSLQKDIIFPIVKSFNGNILKELGDGLLISFNSAIQAVQCSIEIQSKIEFIKNLNYRIGIHVGDVIHRGGDVFGDGVNIASRIQEKCVVGEICVSKTVYDSVRNQTLIQCISLGEVQLKGIAEKLELYKLVRLDSTQLEPHNITPEMSSNESNSIKSFFIGLAFSALILFSGINLYNTFSASSAKISIAVLPFGNTIKDEDFNYLSQQFVDELTHKLINLNYLSIKDFSQVVKIYEKIAPSKANIVDLDIAQQLGEELDAHYILYGNYLIFNKEQIRITCNIANVKNGSILNSFQETYNILDLMKVLDIFPDEIHDLVKKSILNKE